MINYEFLRNNIPYIVEGIVLDTADPDQMGRVKIWIPAVDGEMYEKDNLPWAEYASPFNGQTTDYRSGRQNLTNNGPVAYGFWSIPKIGSQVLVFFLNGDPNRRMYFASYFTLHGNRSLPDGRNIDRPNAGGPGRFTDTYEKIHPAMDNLNQQFKGDLKAPQAKTRGVWERQVAQDKNQKDGTDGYSINVVDEEVLDPQTYCWVTPGHNAIIMQDNPEDCRIRIKTAEGNQIIMDDANERIYVSTARGGCWLEFDEDGHIHLFGKESISIRAGKDLNIVADNDINIEAKNNINIKAVNGSLSASSKGVMTLQSASNNLHITACLELHAIGKTGVHIDGEIMHLNSGTASCGQDPSNPPIVPDHEPWKRPATTITRNPHWKE